MKHPAFDTDTDALTRKNASEMAALEAQQAAEAEQQQKEIDAKEQAATSSSSGSSSQGSSSSENQQQAQQPTKDAAPNDTKTLATPVTAEEAQKKVIAAIEALNAQNATVDATKKAQEAVEQLNSTLSAMCQPIYSVVDMLKTLPDKLKSLIDVDGAAAGAYSGLTSIMDTITKIETVPVSVEVPITLDDFSACPTEYPTLQDEAAKGVQLTDADCAKSGYTKTIVENQWKFLTEMKEAFQAPDEKSIVADTIEKAVNSTIKAAVNAIQPPVQMVASIANIGPLGGMVTEVVNMVDGICKMASTPIPKDKLDEKVRDQQSAAELAKAEVDKVANMATTAKEHGDAAIAAAKDKANQEVENMKKQADEVLKTLSNAFDNLKMPAMPDGLDEALEETWKALMMVMSNMQNIMLVVVFKLVESVFKCFNQIISIIGVPTMPFPLNMIPQLIPAVIDIAMFVITFPISLYNTIKTIAKRKIKAMVVADLPAPPKIEPIVEPIEPTSEDVPTPPEAT